MHCRQEFPQFPQFALPSSRVQGDRMWLQSSVIPTGAERSEAERRDLFLLMRRQKRSLDYAALRAAPLGMTGRLVKCDSPTSEVECTPPK